MKLAGNPEKGLPDRDDCLSVVGHIRSAIRGFVEVLQEEELSGDEMSQKELKKLYNNLVDATIIYLQHWSANRDHECSSVTKLQYKKAELRAPLNGNSLLKIKFSFMKSSMNFHFFVKNCPCNCLGA